MPMTRLSFAPSCAPSCAPSLTASWPFRMITRFFSGLLLCLLAHASWANTFYVGSINRYKPSDTVVQVYPKNLSPGIHGPGSNTNSPLGCEFSGPTFSGSQTLNVRIQPVYGSTFTLTYTDGTTDQVYGSFKGTLTHYVTDGNGQVASCQLNYPTNTGSGCVTTLTSSNTYFKSAGWEGSSFYLELPKRIGAVIKSVGVTSSIGIYSCYTYTSTGLAGYSINHYLKGPFVDGGAFSYDPGNTCALTLSSPSMTLPSVTVSQASGYSVNTRFGSTQTVQAQINCSASTAMGMRITVGDASQAFNASNSDGIMKNTATGAATGVSMALSFGTVTGSSGSPAWGGSPVPYGMAMDLVNGKNVVVPISGQLVRTGTSLAPGNISNAFTISVQYD